MHNGKEEQLIHFSNAQRSNFAIITPVIDNAEDQAIEYLECEFEAHFMLALIGEVFSFISFKEHICYDIK